MSDLVQAKVPSAAERERMHALYREGGARRAMAPHAIYAADTCPHDGCDQRMQAIDFRVEAYGPSVHDPLVPRLVGGYRLCRTLSEVRRVDPLHHPRQTGHHRRRGLHASPTAG